MNCTNCSQLLPTGVGFCPNCGAPTPYNLAGSGAPSPYAPTIAAAPYGNPPSPSADPYDYSKPEQNPYTNYGSAPQVPASYPPPPPANQAGPYYNNAPSAMPGYAPIPGMQPGMYNPAAVPPKKRSKVGLIIGVSLLGVVLLCGGLLAVAAHFGKSSSATQTSYSNTSVTTTSNSVPTNADLVPAAQKILFSPQTSSTIDANYNPTQVATTFPTGKDVNLTFQVDSAGQDGYIKVKWYEDGQEVSSDILAHHAQNNQGYFAYSYTTAGSGAAALYWCTKANCSDEQPAQVVNFTVTSTTSALPAPGANVAATDRKYYI